MIDVKERNRGYAKKHESKRKEAGDTRHVIWLSAEATAALNDLTGDGVVPKEIVFNDAIIKAAKQK